MLIDTCPNSPALLFAPRSSCPSIAMPTPTPSEAFTNATGPSTGACPRTAQTWASTQAFTSFSTTTGSSSAAASGARSSRSLPAQRRRVAQAAAVEVHEPGHHDADAQALAELRVLGRAAARASAPGPSRSPAAGRAHREFLDVEQRVAERIGHQDEQAARAHVDRERAVAAASRCRGGAACGHACSRPWRPRTPASSGSGPSTSRLTAPRRTPISRARSAREMGCVRADQIERDLAVDLARRPTPGDTESVGLIRRIPLPPGSSRGDYGPE